MKNSKHSRSISFKFLSVSLVMCIILYVITIVGSGVLYSKALENRYANLCKTVSQVISGSLEADSINVWLGGRDTHGYVQATNRLERLSVDIPEIESIAIYQMREDGMYTVYNTKSTLLRRDLGNVVSYDAKWGQYKSEFLSGKPVEKIFVNGYYGQTMTYCTPVFDSDNQCVAYVCSRISENSIKNELNGFIKSFGLVLFAIIIFMHFLIYIYIRLKVVNPVNRLGYAMLNPIRKGSVEHMRKIATNRCYSTSEMKNLFRSAAKVFIEKNGLTNMNQEHQKEIMNAFATIINPSNVESEEYKDRVSECTAILCNHMAEKDNFAEFVTPSFCKQLALAAPLHDIGKLTVPDEVIYKPEKLTEEEFDIIKSHSQNGALIIERAKKNMQKKKYLDMAYEVALYHHERWNGTGYPSGLRGTEIPLSARIVAVVDAYDAITRKCCYHDASTPAKAYEKLLAEEGHFDPDVIECFVEVKDKIIELYS